MFTKRGIAAVSVINDLVTDNRVQRTCAALADSGYGVLLIGRQLPRSPALPDWPYRTVRMKLLFNKGPLFYLFFNLRLFFRLLFTRTTLLYSNDLDTLLPNYLVSRLRSIPLIYDSHELFCEVPELAEARLKRRIWERLESYLVPRVKYRVTVNESIAAIFLRKHAAPFYVVRNIADPVKVSSPRSRAELGLPEDKKIVLLQGAGINIDRGAEELVEAMNYVENALLVIIGSGDVWSKLEEKTSAMPGKVKMIHRLPPAELRHYTLAADLGVSIDKNTNPNYYNSLPNKIFDYLHAGLPVLATRLPEIERIVATHSCGVFIENHQPRHIAEVITKTLEGDLTTLKENARAASTHYTWAQEREVLLSVIAQAAGAG